MSIIKFKEKRTYVCWSPCNTDAKWYFTVVKRTRKTLTLAGRFPDGRDIKRVKIYTNVSYNNALECINEEVCKPLGNYSMAPELASTEMVII